MTSPALESRYAWRLAVVSMLCIAVGAGALYLPVVAMPQMAAEFGGQRQIPSLAYTLCYIGVGVGGIGMGWLADRAGPRWPVVAAGLMIGLGAWTAAAGGQWQLLASFTLLMGLFGHSGTFTPLVNNISGWFDRRRGIAIAIVSIGNAVGGFAWPQVYRLTVPAWGWRESLAAYGAFALVSLVLLALYIRPPAGAETRRKSDAREDFSRLPYSSPVTMTLLAVAGLSCCTPMAMPLVHMVAFCVDLGFAAGRGAEAVSLILVVAVVSAFAVGRLADRIGPLPTLLLGSGWQALALAGFLLVNDLPRLYFFSALMGVPFIAMVQAYAMALRDFYGPRLAGWRLGVVFMFTLCGMALGGWIAGVIYDATLRYEPAFLAGIGFNVVNFLCVAALALRWRGRPRVAPA
jgi:MFS family permease